MPTIRRTLALLACLIVTSNFAQAGMIQVSNLSESPSLGFQMKATNWGGAQFTTDNASYSITAVTIPIAFVANASGNFFVDIYTDNAGAPGSQLATLTGSASPTVGNNVYTSAGVGVDPNTSYWVVAGVSSGAGTYSWTMTGSNAESGNWSLGDHILDQFSFDQASNWLSLNFANVFQVQIEADNTSVTPIPEPSTYAMFGIVSAGWFGIRRRRKARIQS